PAVVSGTSAGAINAALIAAGKSPKEMMAFWNSIADDPPVAASPVFFQSAVRTLARLSFEESARLLQSTRPWRSFAQRARNHWPPRRGGFVALWVEYLLATRFELVSRLLDGIREAFVADTSQLRDRLVDVLGGEQVPCNGLRLAINTVDAHT